MTLVKYDFNPNLSICINNGLDAFCIEDRLRLSKWADKNFYLSEESSTDQGPWRTLAYQVAMMDCIGDDRIQTCTFQKSARIGYTKFLVAAIGYFAVHLRRKILMVQPTQDDARGFSRDEVTPAIRDCQVLRDVFIDTDHERSPSNTTLRKTYPGGALDIIGAHSPRGFRRVTKDCVFYDETDGFEETAGNEGDQFTLGDKRMLSSPWPKSVRGSTPTTVENSKILASLQKADLIFHYYVPCPKCKHMQYLQFGGNDCEYGLTWIEGDYKTTKYQCINCKGLIDYSEQHDMVQKGQWRSECGHYIAGENELHNSKGKVVQWVLHVGFVIWSAYSPFVNASWPNIIKEYEEKKGKEDELKAFINTVLGECTEDTFEVIQKDMLEARCEVYEDEVPDGVELLTGMVDVQGNRLELLIVGWGAGEESWSIRHFVFRGAPIKDYVWKDLEIALKRNYKQSNDREIKVTACFIDSGYLKDEVYKYCRLRRKYTRPMKGSATHDDPLINFKKKVEIQHGVHLIIVGVNTGKDILAQRLNIQEVGPGFVHFPLNQEHGPDYFAQLTAERRENQIVRGKKRGVWTNRNNRRNEILDLWVGNFGCMRFLRHKISKPLREAS